jgi:hypothetical protein
LLLKQVRHKAAGIADNEAAVFADAQGGGFVMDDPEAENGVVAVKVGQGGQRLVDLSAWRAAISTAAKARWAKANKTGKSKL